MACGVGRQEGAVMLFGVDISGRVAPPERQPEEAVRRAAKRKKLPAPEKEQLPREYREAVAAKGGDVEGLTLVIEKILTPTDLAKRQDRLNMPKGQLKTQLLFLSPEEQELVCRKRPAAVAGGRSDLYEGVEVTLLDPSLEERTMSLARWGAHNKLEDDEHSRGVEEAERRTKKKSGSWWLSLKKGWLKIAAENGLKEGDSVQIWSFRFKADARLGFVLHKLQPPPTVQASTSTSGRRDEDQDDSHKLKKTKTTTPMVVAVAETSIPYAATPEPS